MSTYKTFWDLQTAVAYSDHEVQQYAPHTTYGGGTFKWIIGNNASITNIPGIRIKPTGTTLGYWERVMGNEVHVDWFGPLHAETTFAGVSLNAAQALALYPGITPAAPSPTIGYTIAATDMVDWAALQQAITYTCNTKKKLVGGGDDFYVNKGLTLNKFVLRFTCDFNWTGIRVTNNNVFDVIGRTVPTDNAQALGNNVDPAMVEAKFDIRNITIGYTSSGMASPETQTGFDLGPSYDACYQNVVVSGMLAGIHLKFALNTSVINCEANGCKKGFIADIGDWPGASALAANSQSNVTTFQNCRAVMQGTETGTFGFGILGCSGCSVNNCIVEGFPCENGVLINGMSSTNVYNASIKNLHFECATGAAGTGAANAAIKIVAAAGTYTIDQCYGQLPAILIDAEAVGANPNTVSIMLSGVYWWVPTPAGKFFRARGNTTNWLFLHNETNVFGLTAAIGGKFDTGTGTGGTAGTTATNVALAAEATGSGAKYKVIPIAR